MSEGCPIDRADGLEIVTVLRGISGSPRPTGRPASVDSRIHRWGARGRGAGSTTRQSHASIAQLQILLPCLEAAFQVF